jgi:hypothetical protein
MDPKATLSHFIGASTVSLGISYLLRDAPLEMPAFQMAALVGAASLGAKWVMPYISGRDGSLTTTYANQIIESALSGGLTYGGNMYMRVRDPDFKTEFTQGAAGNFLGGSVARMVYPLLNPDGYGGKSSTPAAQSGGFF